MWKVFKNSTRAVAYCIRDNVIVIDDTFSYCKQFPEAHTNHAERDAKQLNFNEFEPDFERMHRMSYSLAESLL
jgi:hypothetical protein